MFLFANVHDTFHSVSGCPFSTEVVLTQCGRPVRDLITLSLKEARAQKLKRTQRSINDRPRFSVDRSGLVRVDENIHVRKGSIF